MTWDLINVDTDPALIYSQYTVSEPILELPPVSGLTPITAINGVAGPTITLSGGTTGLSFAPGGNTLSLAGTLVVANGGTGAGTAAGARANLLAAALGANSDITSLTALTLAIISSLRWLGYVSAANDPTTTELPTDKDVAIYKNTVSGNIFLAFNNGGVIVKVGLV